MTVCDKIETLLWEKESGSISAEDNELLQKHLKECAACRKIQPTIEAIGQSRKNDDTAIAGIDPLDFESAIFQKIRARERELKYRREDKSFMIRMYFSMGLAAAIVAFMVYSMADLERFVLPSKPVLYSGGIVENKYDAVQIVLQPEEVDVVAGSPEPQQAEKGEIKDEESITWSAPAQQDASGPVLKETDVSKLFEEKRQEEIAAQDHASRLLTKTPAGEEIIEAEKYKDGDMAESGRLGYYEPARLKSRSGIMASKKIGESTTGADMNTSQFQILNRPVINPAPDSVVINSIYLIDESIPVASQQTRAYLPEVVVDSGIVQSVETPRSVLVTVEKMPIPVKIIPPEYPIWARKNGISGTVWVKAHVNEKGDVEAAEIASSSNPGYGFEEASLEAAKQCKYLPAEANGYKIGIWVIYPVSFVFKTDNSN